MGWPVCNTTLEDEKSQLFGFFPPLVLQTVKVNHLKRIIVEEIDLWEGGITFHQLGLIISAAFASLATILSLYLIFQHATHYLRPREQRQYEPLKTCAMFPTSAFVDF